ncbi:MAG: hypothetical protein JXR78_13760, partial [Victivallales bacterium]|nr:hypothetical protein [Victivallales bacterium]
MINKRYILAIDVGTTSVKTVIFDTCGRELACRICEYALEKPCPDFVEVEPEVYWNAVREGIAGVMNDAGLRQDDIAAVGVTSQAETLIVLDAQGKPLRKAIVWLDNRAKAEAAQIATDFSREEVYRVTGQQEIVPTWTACKLLWLRNHEPETFAEAAEFLMVEDYIIYRLTGNFATDHALNPSTLYYDLVNGCWWDEMLDYLGVRKDQLPELKYSGETAGYVTSASDVAIGSGAAVCVSPIDQVAAAVGAGNIAPGMITETTGSAMAVCATLDAPAYDEKMRIGLYRHALAGQYIMMPWIPTAGMVLRWFRDEMAPDMNYQELSRLAETVPAGCDGMLMLPHLTGAFCPDVNPAATGVFHGIGLGHGRGHFVRAIFEAVAFTLRQNVDVLKEAGLKCSAVRSLGGGAKDALWLQIKADVLDCPVEVPACSEATCLGAAILAAAGAGIFPSVSE